MSPIVTSTAMHRRSRNPGKPDVNLLETGPLGFTNLWAWWPVYKLTGLADGDPINILIDFSGNERHGVATGATRPTYKTNIIGSLPIARYAGNYYFDLGAVYDLDQATYFIVWSRASALNNDAVFISASTTYAYLQYGSTWYYANGVAETVAMAAGSFILKCAKYDNSNVTLYTNGNQNASPASSVNCSFRYIGSGGYSLSGDIAEVILFSEALSDTNRIYIESYLNTKYALW